MLPSAFELCLLQQLHVQTGLITLEKVVRDCEALFSTFCNISMILMLSKLCTSTSTGCMDYLPLELLILNTIDRSRQKWHKALAAHFSWLP